jgi:hypothetical protein
MAIVDLKERCERVENRVSDVEKAVNKMPLLVLTTVSTLILLIVAVVKLWALN